MTAPSNLLSGEFAGRYIIERELGRGATSVVYLADDIELGQRVALKVLRPELTEGIPAERFLRETRLTGELRHPHIVPLLASGTAAGRLYFALPYMDGGTLRDRLSREKQLPIADALAMAATIAEALDFAHERNILHRDVKPENILYSDGAARLSDFGIARAMERAIEESTTSTGVVRGTPAYMSPEQAAGDRDYDGRSDLYSLACVLYEALAGVPAFVGATSQAVIAQRMTHEPRPVRMYRASVSPAVEAVLQRALATSPADRYATAAEFARALQTAAEETTRRSGVGRARAAAFGVAAAGILATTLLAKRAHDTRVVSELIDTSRVALLPIDATDSALGRVTYDAMYDRLRSWRGLTVVDRFAVQGLLPRDVQSEDDANRVARRFGAGQYVRARMSREGDAWRVDATVYRTGKGRLYEASARLPAEPSPESIAVLADRLALRGATDAPASHVLPAAIAYAQAMDAIQSDWNLRLADSLLSKVVELDPTVASAFVWLAEARAALRQPVTSWRPAVDRAHGSPGLAPRESLLTVALLDLADGRFPAACDAFEAMRRTHARDFVPLYGLGQCRSLDSIVVRDSRSPSGWRFRSNPYRAIENYAAAFKAVPLMHRAVARGGYEPLRVMLGVTESFLIPGFAPDGEVFLARPDWQNDSIVFVPYPQGRVSAGTVPLDPRTRQMAHEHLRALFVEIASVWTAALPNDAGAKEAFAIALEMQQDPSSVDSLVVARSLASDELTRIRIAAEEVLLRMEFTPLADTARVARARQLGDSLLAATINPSGETARLLAFVAGALGRCGRAAHLVVQGRRGSFVEATFDSVGVLLAAGCPAVLPALSSASGNVGDGDPQSALRTEYAFAGRALRLAFPADSELFARLAPVGGYLLRAQAAALRHDDAGARAILDQQRTRRGPSGTVSPDTRFLEATLRLRMGDTTGATALLDRVAERKQWLGSAQFDVINVESIIRCLVLRNGLTRRSVVQQRDEWNGFLSSVLSSADPVVRSAIHAVR